MTSADPLDAAIRVVGPATAEEVAALVAVLSAASDGGNGAQPGRRESVWASHRATLRAPVTHGPGAWRTSART